VTIIEPLAGQRQKSESSRAVQACNDYLRMGAGRSIAGLCRQYQESPENTTPTEKVNTIHKWSQKYDWAARAETHDAEIERQKNERAAEIMQSGLALEHERVDVLKRLAGFLDGQLYERGEDGVYHNVWLPDVKQIGSGEFAERVDIERFNAAIIDQYRSTLDDLAKETGGRRLKQELDVTSGGEPIRVVVGGIDLDNGV